MKKLRQRLFQSPFTQPLPISTVWHSAVAVHYPGNDLKRRDAHEQRGRVHTVSRADGVRLGAG
jgi:hypothetical protein